MKKTQIKDATRNIKKNLLSWISVVFIAAMAASSYLGICYSAASMRSAGDSFYQRTSFRDFEVTSSLLLTNEDIDALMADEDVKDVEGVYFANAKVSSGDIHENVNIVSVSERINVPEIAQGSLPQKADECALEQTIAEKLGYTIGDTVTACDEQGDTPKFLKGKAYRITGIVQHPDHLAKPDFAPGNRYILVTPDAFDDEQLDGCFMRAEVVLKSTEGMSRFSDEYKKKTDAAKERLNSIAEERSALRTAEVKDKVFDLTVVRGIHEDVIPARATESIVTALERAGILIETACRSGECGLCRTKVLSGDVFVCPEGDGRRAADKVFGYVHACSAYPVSDCKIKIPIL